MSALHTALAVWLQNLVTHCRSVMTGLSDSSDLKGKPWWLGTFRSQAWLSVSPLPYPVLRQCWEYSQSELPRIPQPR